jgi:peptidoglycan/LPS O-acetylase OafA/YrhL
MPPEKNKEYFYSLTSLRGLASVWVAIGHLSWTVPSAGLLLVLPMLRQGYLAVDFFFMLSGFVLAHAYKMHLMDNLKSYLVFCRARITRIFPIHICILIILCILYFSLLAKGIVLPGIYDIKALFAQLFLVNIAPVFNTSYFFVWNYPAWTLGLEVWWFIILAGGITVFNKLTEKSLEHFSLLKNKKTYLVLACRMMLILIVILLFKHSPSFIDTPNFFNSLVRSGLEFLTGLFLYQAFFIQPFSLNKTERYIVYACILGGIILWFFKIPLYLVVAYWLALIPFILIVSIEKGSALNHILVHPALVYLGNISYSLYLIHGPIERVIAVVYPRFQPTTFNIAFTYLIFIGTTLALATLSYTYIEKPCIQYFKKRRLRNI